MPRTTVTTCLLSTVLLFVSIGGTRADDTGVIDSMEALPQVTGENVKAELVAGKFGQAVEIRFDDGCRNNFAQTRSRANSAWDEADGFSFWVKGDGSDHLGGIEFVWNDDYALRYALAFPINHTDWRKVVVRWRDLVPETANPAALSIEPRRGNAPSKLGPIWFGKWWYWQDFAAHSYTIDDIRLEMSLPDDEPDWQPTGEPLARVKQQISRQEPIKIVIMGDSLADARHWANRDENWPAMLKAKLTASGVKPNIVNTAIGGTELRQNMVLIPGWAQRHRDADLVIICFGGNDWSSGMRGAMFEQTNRAALDAVRRATNAHADVLLCTTCPSLERWDTMAELSLACRAAARSRKAGLADIDAAFHAAGKAAEDRERLFVWDKTHLGPDGHRVFAETVFSALVDTDLVTKDGK